MGPFISAFFVLFLILYFKSSSILEIIEAVYLFVESHYERHRDFEKIDDFTDFAIRAGFKVLCSAVFFALLTLWTWINLPLKHYTRRDLEAERDSALGLIQQLEARNSELETFSEKTLKDRNTYRNDYAVVATKNIVLENKLAQLQLQSEHHADLESRLYQSEEECRDLEKSLERLRRIRHDEDSEHMALSSNLKRTRREIKQLRMSLGSQAKAIDGYQARIMELEEIVKEANEALQKRTELSRLENTRDQAGQNAAIETSAAKTRIVELEKEVMEANEALQKQTELTRLENTRDQASQNAAIKASAAKTRIAELEEMVKEANEALQKRTELTRLENTRDQANQNAAFAAEITDLKLALNGANEDLARELENTRNQLEHTGRLEAAITLSSAERTSLQDQQANSRQLLQQKDAEIERINGRHLEERESQRTEMQALQDSLEARNNSIDVDVHSDHVCDHSKCVDKANLHEQWIRSIEASSINHNVQIISQLQTEASGQGIKIAGLLAQVEDQKAVIGRLRTSVDSSEAVSELQKEVSSLTAKVEDGERKVTSLAMESQTACRKANTAVKATKATKELLQAKEKALEEEKAGRQKAVDLERRIAKERSETSSREEVRRLKEALKEMTVSRDRCRANNETFRKQTVTARTELREGDGVRRKFSNQRDELVKTVGQLYGKMAGMVEVERMEGVESGEPSRKRQNEGDDEDARPAKILRDK